MTNPNEILALRILALEEQQKLELILLKEVIREASTKLNPLEIIKNAIATENNTDGLGTNIVHDLIGMSTGFVSKKLMFGSTTNPFKKIIGSILQFAVAKFVSNHSEKIQAMGEVLFQKLLPSQFIEIEKEKEKPQLNN
jgi:hypothetical protein